MSSDGHNTEIGLNYVELVLCDLCLDGTGGECHVPGCALWLNRASDLPIRDKTKDVAAPVNENPQIRLGGTSRTPARAHVDGAWPTFEITLSYYVENTDDLDEVTRLVVLEQERIGDLALDGALPASGGASDETAMQP